MDGMPPSKVIVSAIRPPVEATSKVYGEEISIDAPGV
jgi:hypothetical protein